MQKAEVMNTGGSPGERSDQSSYRHGPVGLKLGFQLFGNAKTGSEFTIVSTSGVDQVVRHAMEPGP